jgi:hypothetical protein
MIRQDQAMRGGSRVDAASFPSRIGRGANPCLLNPFFGANPDTERNWHEETETPPPTIFPHF